MNQPKVDPNNDEAQKKGGEQEVEKREKEVVDATLKALWPMWIMNKMLNHAIKKLRSIGLIQGPLLMWNITVTMSWIFQ